MKAFKDRVAVITGGAGGIGLALARKAAMEGMRVVLADIDPGAMERALRDLGLPEGRALGVCADVSEEAGVKTLAQKAQEAFGGVHLLVNNAGVGVSKPLWETGIRDWQWVLGVNLWAVIHATRIFVPLMLAQDTECHIVNTASISGLLCTPGQGIYNVSKYGVVALSETLYQELGQRRAKLKVSVLCPAWVKTGIIRSDRTRPASLKEDPLAPPTGEREEAAFWSAIEASPQFSLLTPEAVAEKVFEAVRAERLYIVTHPESKAWIRYRFEDILNDRNPLVLPGL